MTTEANTTADTTQQTPTESKEVIEVNLDKLIKAIENIIAEERQGIKKLIIYKANGEILLKISFTAGLTMAILSTFLLPKLLALGIVGALLGGFKLEVVRRETEQVTTDEVGAKT